MEKRGELINNYVSPKSVYNLPNDIDREPDSALPESRSETNINNVEFTKPENVQPRTESLPGEQYGVPYKNDGTTVTRRTMTSNVVEQYLEQDSVDKDSVDKEAELEQENAWKRQKKQKGKKKRDDQKYYRKNKSRIKKRQNKYQRKPSTKRKIKQRKKRNKNKNTTRRANMVVQAYLRHANDPKTLLRKTSPQTRNKSKSLSFKKVSENNGVLLYRVGEHQVGIQYEPNFKVSCSCSGFQYNGSEYHAYKNGYLLGAPKGTASKPIINDQSNNNYLCKHIVSILQRRE